MGWWYRGGVARGGGIYLTGFSHTPLTKSNKTAHFKHITSHDKALQSILSPFITLPGTMYPIL